MVCVVDMMTTFRCTEEAVLRLRKTTPVLQVAQVCVIWKETLLLLLTSRGPRPRPQDNASARNRNVTGP